MEQSQQHAIDMLVADFALLKVYQAIRTAVNEWSVAALTDFNVHPHLNGKEYYEIIKQSAYFLAEWAATTKSDMERKNTLDHIAQFNKAELHFSQRSAEQSMRKSTNEDFNK